ncbi:hypothetical protein SLH46_06285 [Draconibacterium sp. IB214405]|uniref:hypothetical protein n=1 Tax=Draconibacterium sp. IB214405 TaxID=3097352 RepID=UPI002A0D15FE|nr:hypothetical protein [Draconibacterium sp. IB214405]MDX8338780.1 hypothetical protein [Draconibacterium sp. IB214405]
MSKPHALDEQDTIKLLKRPNPIDGHTTWLRHRIGSEAGTIDLLILEGKYTIKDMIRILKQDHTFRKKTDKEWERRVMNHIEHLSTIEGDARNFTTEGHNLKVEVSDSTGIISFNY